MHSKVKVPQKFGPYDPSWLSCMTHLQYEPVGKLNLVKRNFLQSKEDQKTRRAIIAKFASEVFKDKNNDPLGRFSKDEMTSRMILRTIERETSMLIYTCANIWFSRFNKFSSHVGL